MSKTRLASESLADRLRRINRNILMLAILLLTLVVVASNLVFGLLTRMDANQSTANVLADSVGAALVFNDVPASEELLTSLRNSPDVISAAIYLTDGSRFAGYQNGDATTPQVLRQPPDSVDWHLRYVDITKGIVQESQPAGVLLLRVQLESLYLQLALQLLVIWVAVVLAMTVGQLLSTRLSQQALAPLAELTGLMSKVRDTADFGVRAGATDIRELDTLVSCFNTMLEEVQLRDNRLQEQQEGLEQTVALRTRDLSRAVKQASEASAAKSRFLANMSHEIRTPMNAVLGMAELLAMSELDTAQRQLAGRIYQSGNHLLEIINDILDFSKIESGHMTLEAVPFNLFEAVDNTIVLLRQVAEAKGLQLETSFAPADHAVVVQGDPLRFRQILNNLLGNAIKFTSRGRVALSVHATQVAKGMTAISICVEDNGIGIAPEAHSRIFEQFSQADASTTRQFGGTGLGLTITRRLVDLMHGTIRVESTLGYGAKFFVDVMMPLVQLKFIGAGEQAGPARTTELYTEADVALPFTPPAASTTLSGRILLAEDNVINQELVLAMLAKFGLTADIASNGAQALALATSKPYDLILLDCEMPVMDGFQAAQKIREVLGKTGNGVPMVAMTANALEGDRERCLQAGMDDYMSKPYTLSQVNSMLRRWLPEHSEQ